MGHWWENVTIKIKLTQREAFIYSMRIKVVGYKDIMALRVFLSKENKANCYVVGGVVWKV